MNLSYFLQKIKNYGLEFFKLYYSFYYAEVTDNDDPENLNRLRFDCKELGYKPDYWAFPSLGVSNGHGNRILPSVGDTVMLMFKNGNLRQAVWMYGQTVQGGQITEASSPDKYVFKTPNGVLIEIDDQAKDYHIKTPDGLILSLSDGVISLSKGGALESSMKGQSSQAQLNIDKAKLDALIQAISASPVIAGDGGASFKASIIASMAGVPSADYSNILSNILKNE